MSTEIEDKPPQWDAPPHGESWTADQVAKYLGLVPNPKFGLTPEQPPYLLSTKGALICAVREQIIQAMTVQKKPVVPDIVIPGLVRQGLAR